MTRLPVIFVTLLILGAGATMMSLPAGAASTPTHRLGFWLQDGDVMKYPASTFFNAMFLTPPYPSSIEVMIFAISQDQLGNFGCSASTPYVSGAIKYWGQVAQMADSYPNIHLVFEIAYDPSNGGSGTYGLSCFNILVRALGQYPSVYAMGIEGEYTQMSKGLTLSQVVTAMGDVTSTGKLFVNYYLPTSLIPTGGYVITHTNFPGGDSGGYDQVNTLRNYNSITVGLDSGYYASFRFPGTVSCPIGSSAMNSATAGFNQCVVSTELSTAVSMPSGTRQFLELDPGFDASGSFVGVSGVTTTQLWDNPTLRNWVWTDPNYQGNFILSTGTTSTSKSTTQSTTTATSTSTTVSRTTTSGGDPALTTSVYCMSGSGPCGSIAPLGSSYYPAGTSVKLSATPDSGHSFQYWHVCTSSCQNYHVSVITVTVNAATKAIAVFN